MKSIKTVLQAILYVILAVSLHLTLIYFLDIRIEGWGTELLTYLLKVYFVPLLLCFINSLMFIRIRRMKYHINWFLVTLIPSCLLLLFFKAIQDVGDPEYGAFVSIEFFPKYQVEMLFLLPWSIFIIQFILTLYYLIKIRKKGFMS
ncbi:hypothetical protein A3849_26545 [Paenibacillus sp. P46E]|nr:hypothetical protein A3849_26545 [Paenibacillus sp. P46E]